MKLLFFTHAYPPLRYPRSIQISRLVKHLHCNVDVVCCNEVSVEPDKSLPAIFENNPGKIFRFDYVPIKYSVLRKIVNICAIPDAFLGWSLRAALQIVEVAASKKYDVVVTFGQPMSTHLAGLLLKKKLQLPWIAHFSDPWADNPFHTKNLIRCWVNRILERRVVSKADMIIFTSSKTRDLVMRKYDSDLYRKAKVLPHCFDADIYPSFRLKSKSEVIIRHLGNFYPPRSPVILLKSLKIIYQRSPSLLKNVRFEFIGGISSRIKVDAFLSDLPHGLVRFQPSVEYLESIRLMREASILLSIDAPFEDSIFLPSKLIDYLGAEVPIMAITPNGTSADLVCEYGGVVASASDPLDVASKLETLLEENFHIDFENKLNKVCRDKYSAAEVTSQFEEIVRSVILQK